MVWPIRPRGSSLELAELLRSLANSRARSSKAGVSMNFSAWAERRRREATSRRRASSPAQESERKVLRRLSSRASAEWESSSTRFQRSGFISRLRGEFPNKPSLGEPPVAVHGFYGNAENSGGFLDAHASEKAQFHDLAFARIETAEDGESVIQRNDVRALTRLRNERFVEGKVHGVSSSL